MTIAAMKQAADFIASVHNGEWNGNFDRDLIESNLLAAISEQEKCEPVAWQARVAAGQTDYANWVHYYTVGRGGCPIDADGNWIEGHPHHWKFNDNPGKNLKLLSLKPLFTHPAPVPAGWLRAIDEAMVCSHLGVANASDSYEVAKKKLNDLICWNVQVATDPAVNGGMQLVPVEPTPEMLKELDNTHFGEYNPLSKSIRVCTYKAMLAAAPKEKS